MILGFWFNRKKTWALKCSMNVHFQFSSAFKVQFLQYKIDSNRVLNLFFLIIPFERMEDCTSIKDQKTYFLCCDRLQVYIKNHVYCIDFDLDPRLSTEVRNVATRPRK